MNPTHAPTATRRRRTSGDVARGLAATLALAGFVLGVPAALVVVAPVRLTRTWPTWDTVLTTLTLPDDGTLFLGAVWLISIVGLGLLIVLISAVDRVIERRRVVASLAAIGTPRRTLVLAQLAQSLVGIVPAVALAVACGMACATAYLHFGQVDRGVHPVGLVVPRRARRPGRRGLRRPRDDSRGRRPPGAGEPTARMTTLPEQPDR